MWFGKLGCRRWLTLRRLEGGGITSRSVLALLVSILLMGLSGTLISSGRPGPTSWAG
jgi:hypothetical protein